MSAIVALDLLWLPKCPSGSRKSPICPLRSHKPLSHKHRDRKGIVRQDRVRCQPVRSDCLRQYFLRVATSAHPANKNEDRMSVVWGKSVSVRVDRGGVRIIKQ